MQAQKNGFTLVELLVVISIISLLLAIAVPSLNKARQYSKRTACKANLHDIGLGLRMYLNDYRNVMPPAGSEAWSYNAEFQRSLPPRYSIVHYLGTYLSVSSSELSSTSKKCYCKVLCCPADKREGVAYYYFKYQETSYSYNQMLGDQFLNKRGFRSSIKDKDMEAMGDFDAFHGKKGELGSYNYLFADCHVGDRKGF
jgi:prepilin-type N-terminal cleavage/methylation domain-containing protein/prepilin-type processing-associated H-X9-DG protein